MKKLITLSILALMMAPVIAQKYTGPVIFGPVIQHEGNGKIGNSDTLFGNFYNSQAAMYTSNNGGFASGNNGYLDIAKVQQFNISTPYTVTGVALWFGHKTYNSNSPASGVTVTLYRMDGTGFDAAGMGDAPGTVERTVFLPMSDIIVNGTQKNIINFALPFVANAKYAIGIDMLALAPQDTVALYTTTDGGGDMDDHAWEQFNDGDWYTFLASGSWGMDVDFAIFPIVDFGTTGIVKNPGINNGISKSNISPNPVQALTNINYTLDGAYGDVIIEIFNSNGALINSISQGKLAAGTYAIGIDMSTYKNGIYTCKINAGAFTKNTKLVVSH